MKKKEKKIKAALLKKKAFEDKAVQIVEELCEENISAGWLIDAANYLNQNYYNDGVEERALTGMCGYPLCDKKREVTKKQGRYHISLKDKRVYDLEERRLFCSNMCFKASNFLKNQLETSPLWIREVERPEPVSLYSGGENVDVGSIDIALIDHVEKRDISINDYKEEIPNNVKKEETLKETNIVTTVPVKSNIEQDAKKPAVEVAISAVHQWFTIDSFRMLMGAEELKLRLKEKDVEANLLAMAVGNDNLKEQYQARYRDICRKLDMQDRLDDIEESDKLSSLNFDIMKKHCELENLKMQSFMDGKDKYEIEQMQSLSIVEKSTCDIEPRIPPIDHQAQHLLRRRIVQDKLLKTLPELTKLIKCPMELIRDDLKELLHSFKFSADNVVFKADEWNMLGLLVLKLLSLKCSELSEALNDQHSTKYISLLLANENVNISILDEVVRDLTSDILKLVTKYNIVY